MSGRLTMVLHSGTLSQEKFAVSVLNYKVANVYLERHLKSPKYILLADCMFKFNTGRLCINTQILTVRVTETPRAAL